MRLEEQQEIQKVVGEYVVTTQKEMGVGIQKGASACSCQYKQRFRKTKRDLQTPISTNSAKAFAQCYA